MQISQYMILYTPHGAKAGVAIGPRPAETYRGARRNAAKVEMRHAKARMRKAAREAPVVEVVAPVQSAGE